MELNIAGIIYITDNNHLFQPGKEKLNKNNFH
jgi:hypothetical protein